VNTTTLVLTIAALAVSIVALVVSAISATRQARLIRRGHQLPVVLEFFKEWRSP
jgi:hypothetical protein